MENTSNNQLMQPTNQSNVLPTLPPEPVVSQVQPLVSTPSVKEVTKETNDKSVKSKNANTLIIVLAVVIVVVLFVISFLLGRLTAPIQTVEVTKDDDTEVKISKFDSSLWLTRSQNGSGTFNILNDTLTINLKTSLLESGTAFARYDLRNKITSDFNVSVKATDYVLDGVTSSSLNRVVLAFDANDTNFFNIRLVSDINSTYIDSRYVSDTANETSEKIVLDGTEDITFYALRESNNVTLSYSIDGATPVVLREVEDFINLPVTPSLQMYAGVNNLEEEDIQVTFSDWSVE